MMTPGMGFTDRSHPADILGLWRANTAVRATRRRQRACPVTGREIGTPHPSAALAIGQALEGKYKIIREIGRGRHGVVYEGLHVALDRRVAVKTLRHEMTTTPTWPPASNAGRRPAPSAIPTSSMSSTWAARPTDFCSWSWSYSTAKPLTTLLQQSPLLPVPLAVNLMTQVLGGLSAAHKHGIVHRDLKPDNIFIINTEDRPNFVKIVDFGIAKKLSPRQPGQVSPAAMSGTMVGTVMGTPLYMSPEQAIGPGGGDRPPHGYLRGRRGAVRDAVWSHGLSKVTATQPSWARFWRASTRRPTLCGPTSRPLSKPPSARHRPRHPERFPVGGSHARLPSAAVAPRRRRPTDCTISPGAPTMAVFKTGHLRPRQEAPLPALLCWNKRSPAPGVPFARARDDRAWPAARRRCFAPPPEQSAAGVGRHPLGIVAATPSRPDGQALKQLLVRRSRRPARSAPRR